MTGPILSPQEIVSNLRDSGVIGEAVAILLEQRINTCTAQAREEGRNEAIIEAVKKAEATVNRTRGERQKSSASRVLWAVKGLLPAELAMRHEIARARDNGYHHGYRQGRQSADSERNPRGHR